MGRSGVSYTLCLTEINDSNKSFEDWNDRYRTETTWEMFNEQMMQVETMYWSTHVLNDAHRILRRLKLPEPK
jgi:hypothetical protein